MDAECFQPHQVLGDAVQYQRYVETQQQLQQEQQQQQQQTGPNDARGSSGMASVDASTVNPDVRAAACLLGDKGVQLIDIYRELEACREAAVQQMTLNSSMRTLTHQQQQHHHYHRPSPAGATGSAVGQLLSKATVMDTIKQSHDARVMAAWKAQQAVWAQQAAHLSAVAAKHPAQLALTSAGEDWRNKQELLSALEVAVPAAAAAHTRKPGPIGLDGSNADGMDGGKGSIGDGGPVEGVACAGGNWMSSLRNANECLLQIGNIFSGLYLSVRNTSTVAAAGLTAIRKPREAAFEAHVPGSGLMFSTGLGGTQEPPAGSTALANTTAKLIGAGGTQKPAAGSTGSSSDLAAHTSLGGARTGCAGHDSLRSTSQRAQWCQEAYLQDKLRAGAAAVKVLQTHSPDASQLGVRGWSIEAALTASPLTQTPVSLADVERRLAVADSPLWLEYQAAQQREASQAAAAAAAAQQAAKRAAARAAATQLPRPGPHVEASDTQLTMHYTIPSNSDPTCPHILSTPREPPSWAAIRGSSDSQLGGDQAQVGATGAVAKLTLVSTGTAAVFYNWVRQGRQRLPVATAAAADAAGAAGEGVSCTTAAAAEAAGGGVSGALFTMPDLQGVILPGESKTFRFSFTSPTPCIIHEAWACFTHPPLEPSADRSRRRGEPLTLALKGVAVADGDSGGPGLVAAGQLSAQLEAKTRDAQVKAVLATILSSVQQQVAGSTHSSSSSRLPAGYDPTLASRWAAANPPGSCGCSSSDSNNGNSSSSSEQQGAGEAAPDDTRQAAPAPTDAGAAAQDAAASVPQPDAPAVDTARLCVHFYSPGTYALLSAVYSQARELLQPTPPAPVDPPKKGSSVHRPGTGPTKKAPNNSNKEATSASGPDSTEPLLPPTWDPPSIAGLRGLLARLAVAGPPGSAQRQAAAVLGQQLEVALAGAAVPPCRTQLVEAAARRVLLGLADAVEEAAVSAAHQALAATPSTETSSSTGAGSRTHRGPHNRHSSGGGTPAGAATHRGGGGRGGGHSGGGGDAAAAAAARAQQEGGVALQQVLSDAVGGEVGQALSGFEGVLQQQEAAAAAAVDSNAARGGGAGDYEGVAWRQFAAARAKQQLGLV